MSEAFIVACLAALLGFLSKYRQLKYCFEVAFVIITIFLSIRYMWGNDMPSYVHIFNMFNFYESNILKILSDVYSERVEGGWIILNLLFAPIGFIGLQVFLAVIQNYIIYRVIKDYVPPKWYSLSLFLYCFNPMFMVLSASMMRQFLAMCLFMFACRYIIERKFISYVLVSLIAVSIHKSALLALPFYGLCFFDLNFSKKQIIIIISAIVVWFFLASYFLKDFIIHLVSTSEDFASYQNYLDDKLQEGGSGFGVLFKLVLVILPLFLFKRFSWEIRLFTVVSSCAIIFIPLLSFSSQFTRISLFFQFFSIISFPFIFEEFPRNGCLKYFRILLLVLLILVTFKDFIGFFESPVYHDAFYEYRTIFENSY